MTRTESQSSGLHQPKALLVDDRLRREVGEGLVDVVQRLRAADPPMTWTEIANRLSRWAEVPVSRQLLQQWAASWKDAA